VSFLAAFPERGFTMSEIVRATKINVASCHAVLATLVEAGYLTRCPHQRTYTLGRILVAIGEAALQAQPVISRAKAAAERLNRDLDLPVQLSTVVNDEVVALFSLADASGRGLRMRAGERLPLVAPIGAPFVAWASEEEISAWIGRHTGPRNRKLASMWRHTLDLTRRRGYQAAFRAPNSPEIASLMSALASGGTVPNYKDEVLRLINSFEHELVQPETIEPDEIYNILLISAPIFDQTGQALFNLSLIDLPTSLKGSTIASYADRLVRTSLDVMRAHRDHPLIRQGEHAARRSPSAN
jgi:DNA-binding IclR family transcriptional regulator